MTVQLQPATYAWEPTSEALAAANGLDAANMIRFDTNTPPAPPDLARRVLAGGRFEPGLSEYPSSDYGRLVAAAADRYGVTPDNVLVGAGADEVLDLVAKAYLTAGSTAVTASPTYAMYQVVTEQRAARLLEVPRGGTSAGYRLDQEALRRAAASASLVWLCNPNNPTATADGQDVLGDLLAGLLEDARHDGRREPVVVLDEAYAEFTAATGLPLLESYPRLVVARTLSKAYCLAGIRVGFGLAKEATLEPMQQRRPPASVSVVSATIAAAVLADPDLPKPEVERVSVERERLAHALRSTGWHVSPSVTNFLLIDFPNAGEAAGVARALLARGLVVRTFDVGHLLAASLRLTVRSNAENDRLIEAVREMSR